MRTVYLGLPLGALALARHGYVPTVAVLSPFGGPGRRRVCRQLGPRGTLVLSGADLRAPEVFRALRAAAPDALLSWFWPRRIPAEVLALPPRGAFGTHPSLLPRWRGPDPYFWTLRSGDLVTGVTLHRLEPTYDTGAIVETREVRVHPGDDAWRLARRLDPPALELLVSCAARLNAGEALLGRPQTEAGISWAPEPSPEDLAIRWDAPTGEILRLVRAAAPWPGAGTRIGPHEVQVLRAERRPGALPAALAPGEALVTASGLAVRTRDGGIRVVEVRLEDGRRLQGPEVSDLLTPGDQLPS